MKTRTFNYLILTVITFCLLVQSTYSQFIRPQTPRHIFSLDPYLVDLDPAKWLKEYGVDTTSVDSVKAALNRTDLLFLNTFAAQFFAQRKMTNFIPDIRARYIAANNFSLDGFHYLGSLYNLGATDIHSLLNGFVDSVHAQFILKNRDQDLLLKEDRYSIFYAVRCIEVLGEFGDYSQFNTFIDFIKDENPLYGGVSTLNKFIGKIDQNSENIIYNALIVYATKSYDRYHAVNGLQSYVDRPETFPTLLSVALNDSDYNVRTAAKGILLDEYHNRREVFDLVVSRLYNEDGKSGEYGQGAALYHLDFFNYPEVLIVLKDAVQNAIFLNPQDRETAQSSYRNYEPPHPNSVVTIASMIDSLSSLITQTTQLNWLGLSSFSTQLQTYLTTAKTKLQAGDSVGCYQSVKQFQNGVNAEYRDTLNTTTNFVTIEGWKFLYYNAQYILDRLPKPPPPSLVAALKNSNGAYLLTGTLQYYDASWKDAVNNNDGTFSINTTKTTLSLRMTYSYGSQQKNNVPVNSDTVIFQTVNAQVQLKNSSNVLLDTGTVQYYAGAWRTFGTTTNGVARKELLPKNYKFR